MKRAISEEIRMRGDREREKEREKKIAMNEKKSKYQKRRGGVRGGKREKVSGRE